MHNVILGKYKGLLLLSSFWTLSITWFLKFLKNIETFTAFQRMVLPSSSGKKTGETPILLD
jgi:hypothetical protein